MLEVRNLTISYRGRDGRHTRAVEGVGFDLAAGETLGLLGESGCGKTTLALALLRLLPLTAQFACGSIRFHDLDVIAADDRALRRLRGARAAIVFQEPATALNPVMRVGDQIAEVARAHAKGSRRSYREKAESVLAEVCLAEARIYSQYPHQLSSGQRQRVAIAQALVCKPELLIADEPTSALDNVTQVEIIQLLQELKQRHRLAVLFITHDPALLAGIADRVLIMRRGCVVEEGPREKIFRNPTAPYTQTLLQSVPPLPWDRKGNGRTYSAGR